MLVNSMVHLTLNRDEALAIAHHIGDDAQLQFVKRRLVKALVDADFSPIAFSYELVIMPIAYRRLKKHL